MTGPIRPTGVYIDNEETYQSIYFKQNNIDTAAFINNGTNRTIYLRLWGLNREQNFLFSENALQTTINNTTDLGTTSTRWKDAYLVNSPNVGSDQRIKKDISTLDIHLITKLLMSIPAVQYRLIYGESGRFHYGFLAQDVESALTESELTGLDFAGFIKSPVLDDDENETGDYIYALRLEEFIPILWAHQQDVERRLQAAGL